MSNLDLLNKKKIAEDKLNSFDFDKEFSTFKFNLGLQNKK